jgi:hypothetical protein
MSKPAALSKYRPSYTTAGIDTLYSSFPIPGSGSSSELYAAIRALLRHETHVDTEHRSFRRLNGLHPSFVVLHGSGDSKSRERLRIQQLLDDSLKDIFDAVSILITDIIYFLNDLQITVQDRIDGGITLMIRCPGYRINEDFSAQDITLDLYMPPRELNEGGAVFRESVARLAQSFGTEIVLPHLHRYTNRCAIEQIVVPQAPGRLNIIFSLTI